MKKWALGALIIGLVLLAKVVGSKAQHIDWEQRFERMPDSAPPKWMFNNIGAIRQNTDHIIELLEGGVHRDESSEIARSTP